MFRDRADLPTYFTQAAAARDSVVSNFFNFLHSGRHVLARIMESLCDITCGLLCFF